jgi:alkaline phosphatase D
MSDSRLVRARRHVLLRGASSAALVAFAGCASPGGFGGRDPFTLGVASGYPSPEGVVLWTRLAPEPLSPDGAGGMMRDAVDVAWEVAEDRAMQRVVRRSTVPAMASDAHSVHVEVAGLRPARWYWYRFLAGGIASPIGRTRTAPAANAPHERLRFAYASCQQYEQGYYVAHRHMAAEDLDLVVFLGDYIYESSWGAQHVRKHDGPMPETLAGYRNRHALYKSDADLRAAHAAFPWLVTWDDHEVENDYADDRSETLAPREAFLRRRAAAYQAYWEHMPLPERARPRGPAMQLYARADFGTLVRFHVLDDRQYRSHQACSRPGRGGSAVVDESCAERLDPARTLLGAAQERWLEDGLVAARPRWNVIAQQSLMAQLVRPGAGRGRRFWNDAWDGYPVARRRLLDVIATRRPAHPLVIGGDVHAYFVAGLRPDFDDPRSPVVASEICGTSISSQGPAYARLDRLAAANPHLIVADGTQRGYVSMTLTPARAEAKLQTVESVKTRDAALRTLATVIVENGRPEPVLATG